MSSKSDSYSKFMDALDVTNRALEANSDSLVYGKLLDLGDEVLEGKKFGVAVYRDDPDTPHDYFTLRWHNRKLELDARGKNAPDLAWKVSESFLDDVASNPDAYIDQPAKLDLHWLLSRAGVDA